ncbi:hypothetical protein LLG10_00650 [bacterium]|nr:hypothetical protein [bacterium]
MNNKLPTKQRVTIFINPDLLKQAKAQAVLEDITLANLIERALLQHLPKEIVIKKPELKI